MATTTRWANGAPVCGLLLAVVTAVAAWPPPPPAERRDDRGGAEDVPTAALPASPQGSSSSTRQPVEPIRPYLLDLGRDHATICWLTDEEEIGRVRLFSYAEESVHEEQRPASRYHKVVMRGLEPGSTYRYEVGLNYRGSFTTADRSPSFEVAVFGHPGGTERPMEYPTELLPGHLVDLAPEIALCTGDITYHANLRNFRECFFQRFGEYMASRPIYVAPANHDGLWNGHDYAEFRRLFPHDFGPASGGSFWVDYKHARFFAFTYKLATKEAFREHLDWLTSALGASEQEFNIVFMGGQDTEYYDRDQFFKTIAEQRVDLVLGGDGGGVWQTQLHGVDFYFAGDGAMRAYPFYYLRFYDHHFNVQTRYSDASIPSANHRSFYSKKKRRVVQDLAGAKRQSEPHILHYAGFAQPSSAVGGVRLTVDWPHDFDTELQLQWKAKGRGGLVREQYHLIRAKARQELLIALPPVHPEQVVGEPYEIEELLIRLVPYRLKVEDYPLQDKVSDVHLFAR